MTLSQNTIIYSNQFLAIQKSFALQYFRHCAKIFPYTRRFFSCHLCLLSTWQDLFYVSIPCILPWSSDSLYHNIANCKRWVHVSLANITLFHRVCGVSTFIYTWTCTNIFYPVHNGDFTHSIQNVLGKIKFSYFMHFLHI